MKKKSPLSIALFTKEEEMTYLNACKEWFQYSF